MVPVPGGVWRLVARAQRVGFSEGLRGKGGGWLALGIAAWGLQRVRTAAGADDEILIREAVARGETLTITNTGVTRGQARSTAKAADKEARSPGQRAQRERKDAASRSRGRGRRRTVDAEAQRRAEEAEEAAADARRRADEAATFAAVGPRRRRRRS